MYGKILPKGSQDFLAAIEDRTPAPLAGWTLAGGTGLAMHLGHRVSEDFDFFRDDRVQFSELLETLRALGTCETLQRETRTLTVLLSGVKLSFFQVSYPLLFPAALYSFFRVADVRDIALMKLLAVTNRGSRRDFADLYCIFRRDLTLQECLDLLPRKYGEGTVNDYQVLKSLTWFEDAEQEPALRMLEPFSWEECKAFFLREVHALLLPP
jgi:hypothetical protein